MNPEILRNIQNERIAEKKQVKDIMQQPTVPVVQMPEVARPEITFEEHLGFLQEHQERLKRLDKNSEYATVKINSRTPIGIVMSSDWHLGSKYTDYDTFNKHMNLIKNEPNAFLVALSNTIDGYIFPSGMFAELVHIPEQVEIAKQFAKGFREKLLCVVGSNCHDWTASKGGISPQETAFMESVDGGMPFFPHGGVLTVDFNDIKYDMGLVHKSRFHSSLNPTNANRQLASLRWPVDVVAIAHHHVAQVLQTSMYEGPYKKDVVWVRTGAYKIDDGYSKDEGYGAAQLGGTMVVLDPREKKITPFFRLEDGVGYLKALRELDQLKNGIPA